MKLYGFDISTPCNKVRYVANKLGMDYEYIIINALEGEHKSEEHIKRHPAGKVPVINDDGFILFESNAIVKYLADKINSPLYPKDLKQRAIIDQWMDFINIHVANGVNKVFGNRIIFPKVGIEIDERSIQDGLSFLDRFLPILDNQLKNNQYIAGDKLTLADFCLIACIDPLEVIQVEISLYSHLKAYREALMAEDFYQKCFSTYADCLTNLG
jgi:glutathione S-transferase